MTLEDYHSIPIGQNISDVQVQMGRPYEVKNLYENKEEYIYIERFSVGEGREYFRKYIFVVEQGKIIDKKLKEESSLPIQIVG